VNADLHRSHRHSQLTVCDPVGARTVRLTEHSSIDKRLSEMGYRVVGEWRCTSRGVDSDYWQTTVEPIHTTTTT
jgi:hypothetical protein